MFRWLAAGCFEALAQNLSAMLRLAAGRKEETAAIIDNRTLRSTPESVPCTGYDGAKRKRGGDRKTAARLAANIQDATGDSVELAYVARVRRRR